MKSAGSRLSNQEAGVEKTARLSPKQERILPEIVEGLATSDLQRAELILTLTSFKRATEINIVVARKNPRDPEPEITDDQKEALVAAQITQLEKVGVAVVRGKREKNWGGSDAPGSENGWIEEEILYVGVQKDDAERLSKIDGHWEAGNEKELGELYGFPPTAIEAFSQGLVAGKQRRGEFRMEQQDLPKEIREEEYMAFLQFVLSKEHWKEELETVKAWAETVRTYHPALYERIVRPYRKQKQWNERRAEIDKIGDRLGKGIDEKIKDTVAALNVHGFPTSQSCEGHVHDGTTEEEPGGLPYPWVQISAPEPEGFEHDEAKKKERKQENLKLQQKMTALLAEFYAGRETPFDARLAFDAIGIFGGFGKLGYTLFILLGYFLLIFVRIGVFLVRHGLIVPAVCLSVT